MFKLLRKAYKINKLFSNLTTFDVGEKEGYNITVIPIIEGAECDELTFTTYMPLKAKPLEIMRGIKKTAKKEGITFPKKYRISCWM